MADEQTNPSEGSPRRPIGLRDIGKGMGAFFPGAPEEDSGAVATDGPEPKEQEAPEAEDLDTQSEDVEAEDVQETDISEDEETEPEGEEDSGGFRLTLTVNGEEVVVEDEEEARSLAQRGKHYTQEMQALREEQRQWESEKQEITAQMRQEQSQYAAALDTLEQTFGAVLGDEPDWNAIYEENPEQYAHLRAQWDQLQAIRAEKERITREQQEEQQKQVQEWVQQQQDELRTKKPEWTDPSQRQQDLEMIRDYALERGVADEELNNLYDHRFWLVLHDAARFRQAQSSGKKQAKKAKKKTASPGSKKDEAKAGTRRYKQNRKKLKDTGDLRAAGEIFQQVMEKSGS